MHLFQNVATLFHKKCNSRCQLADGYFAFVKRQKEATRAVHARVSTNSQLSFASLALSRAVRILKLWLALSIRIRAHSSY
jgi:hypothetical protein